MILLLSALTSGLHAMNTLVTIACKGRTLDDILVKYKFPLWKMLFAIITRGFVDMSIFMIKDAYFGAVYYGYCPSQVTNLTVTSVSVYVYYPYFWLWYTM